MRLDKFLSHATSIVRDQSKRAVRKKRVTVNGEVVRSAAQQVSEEDAICLDGERIYLPKPRYFMLHKPQGYVCATEDSEHPIVLDLLQEGSAAGLSIAGRLDIDTTGLVLLSDDGQWLHRVTAPRHLFPKVYQATLHDAVDESTIEQFQRGIMLRGETKATAPAQCIALADKRAEVTLQEGRYHQVKRMFAACGNHVVALHRQQIGAVRLDDNLALGAYRSLTQEEIESFQP